MEKISKGILEKVRTAIERYSLLEGKRIYVAYSGGKDSLFLCLVLKELGYHVYPVIIDIGYNSDWGIALDNLKLFGIDDGLLIGMETISHMMPEITAELDENFKFIRKIKEGYYKKATICTPCHNAKMIVLKRWAEINGIRTIASGHHAIDAVSSLLKSFYMYVDRWEYRHEEYIYENFHNLILSQKEFYLCEGDEFQRLPLYNRIKAQIDAQNAGTDEPIVQYWGDTAIKLCRPLFGVTEMEIIEYFKSQGMNTFNESECFATHFREKGKWTPRELIQYELLLNAPYSLQFCLLELAKMSLDANGFQKYNVRNNREKILGSAYKNEKINNIKK